MVLLSDVTMPSARMERPSQAPKTLSLPKFENPAGLPAFYPNVLGYAI
jgi:hypothetical protein